MLCIILMVKIINSRFFIKNNQSVQNNRFTLQMIFVYSYLLAPWLSSVEKKNVKWMIVNLQWFHSEWTIFEDSVICITFRILGLFTIFNGLVNKNFRYYLSIMAGHLMTWFMLMFDDLFTVILKNVFHQ